jgi:formylglycine-generating enzyme required for sulfatase activity
MEEWRRAQARGDAEAAQVHEVAVRRLDPGPWRRELAGDGVLRVAGVAPGSRAWLFRYVREADAVPRGGPRLLPLPFDVARRATDVPEAYREAVRRRLEGEDPGAVGAHAPSIAERTAGTEAHVATLAGPMARERYAALLAASAYPLVATDSNELALADGLAETALPMGSYLLLVRAAGGGEGRFPFEVLRNRSVEISVGELPGAGEEAHPFVWIPGTDGAPPFWAARFELTLEEYWEFLNDPRTLREIDGHRDRGLRFVPRIDGRPIAERRADGSWTLPPNPEQPLSGVSLFDVAGYLQPPPTEEEPRDDQVVGLAGRLARSAVVGDEMPWGYLRWRSERSLERARQARAGAPVLPDVVVRARPDGGTEVHARLFTLPTESEWTRMARGDHRPFVYGAEREWLAFKGSRSRRSNPAPEPVGLFADDESPFGVRDLTGSVAEWTGDLEEAGGRFRVKGSSWAWHGGDEDRIDSQRSQRPDVADMAIGVRLVVRATVAPD